MTTMKYAPSGKTYELHSYVDPHPGKGAKDRVHWDEDCQRCGGSGIYRWTNRYGLCEGTCYGCWGTGKVERSNAVQTLRKRAKEDALWAEYGPELRAYHAERGREAEELRIAEEFAQAWDEAHAEQDRRAALTQGFLGDVGAKVTNVAMTVRYAKYNEAPSWNRSATMFVIGETPSGQVIKISGSSRSLFGLQRGDEVMILSAKVRDHAEYEGQEQTILWHVKIDEFDKQAAQAMAYGTTDADEAIERGYIKKGEEARFEAYVEAQRVEYEKELLDA